MRGISAKSIIIWRIRATFIASAGMFVSGGVCVFSIQIGIALTVLLLIIYTICIIFYIPMLYRQYYYNIYNNTIELRKGVILKRRIIIDRRKIQYHELRQTPLQKLYKTAALKIYTCGTYIIISQLELEEAKRYTSYSLH